MSRVSQSIVESLIEGQDLVHNPVDEVINTIVNTLALTDMRDDPEYGYDPRTVSEEEVNELNNELAKLNVSVGDANAYNPETRKYTISRALVQEIAETFKVGNHPVTGFARVEGMPHQKIREILKSILTPRVQPPKPRPIS